MLWWSRLDVNWLTRELGLVIMWEGMLLRELIIGIWVVSLVVCMRLSDVLIMVVLTFVCW